MYSNFKNMDQFISDRELQNYHERVIKQLRPSNVQNYKLNDIFHQDILGNMKSYLKKDIQETLDCYYYELWTATSVMCFRLIEGELKTHINCDLEIDDEILSIGKCIRILKEEGYDERFLEGLDDIREKRNLGMYGEKRFSSIEASQFLHNALFFISWVYNFY